ncbi:MAG: WYL domain-containing protein [Salinibacterium sp.]|nr:MAG: WYL domain-containing protein [Salinibacterium sp.]
MSGASTSGAVPIEERLFSLVLALLATDSGLTKSDILSTVRGYSQRYSAAGDNANLERQFERDKDDIRELGIPIDTIDSPGDPGNNQNLRYRISRGDYELPADIRFSPDETALLNLAAMVWREGSLSAESRRAIVKLRALGVAVTEPVLGYAPRVRVRDAAFEPLSIALEKRQVVQFDYLKPGESDSRQRTVAPLALVQHQGRWHLYADEPNSGSTRTFLLRRIVSPVSITGKSFPAPPPGQSDRALAELDDVWNSHLALVEVEQGTDAAARLGNRRGTTVTADGALELHYSDLNIVADELAGYGPEVLVLAPQELRDAVRTRLARAAADHG